MAGNIARFMNHSCAPNLVSKIVELSGKSNSLDKKIVFYAKRDAGWARSSPSTTSSRSAARRSSATAARRVLGADELR